jgi:hypothetical protein
VSFVKDRSVKRERFGDGDEETGLVEKEESRENG